MSNDWRLTVGEALRRPSFQHAQVVAGSKGLSRPIRWVHVLESADTGKYLNGGELILTTGLGFGEAKEKRLAYLSELIHRKTVGLCVELGTYLPLIPLDMLEMAEHHQFPLIVFHQPVRFVDITLDLHEHLTNRQLRALRDLESYSRSLQQLSLQSHGLPKLLQHFQSAVQTQVFLYTPDSVPLFSPPVAQVVQTELSALMREYFVADNKANPNAHFLPLNDKKQIVYQPVMAMGHLLAYVGMVLYERTADEFILLTLDNTVHAIAQILMRKMFVEEQALAMEYRLFDDLLARRPLTEEQIRAILGLSASARPPAYHLMMLAFERNGSQEETLPPHDATAVFRSLLERLGFRPFIRCVGNRFTFLLVEKQPVSRPRKLLDRVMAELQRILVQLMGADTTIRFGVSRSSHRFSDASKHLAEAEQALLFQHESASPYFADLGLFRLLFHIPQEPVLDSFISDYLGPLIKYDEKHGSSLVHTLRVYLDCHLSKQETAEKLFIHRQTLYHRLEKIKECIGEDFTSPERRICLEIALRTVSWAHKEFPAHQIQK